MEAARRQQTIETVTTLYNGKLRLERRNANPTIHAGTFLHGKTVGKSTGETTLGAATRVPASATLPSLQVTSPTRYGNGCSVVRRNDSCESNPKRFHEPLS